MSSIKKFFTFSAIGLGCIAAVAPESLDLSKHDGSKCSDADNNCCASESWGEAQTCADGWVPMPTEPSDFCTGQSAGCGIYKEGIGCYGCFPPDTCTQSNMTYTTLNLTLNGCSYYLTPAPESLDLSKHDGSKCSDSGSDCCASESETWGDPEAQTCADGWVPIPTEPSDCPSSWQSVGCATHFGGIGCYGCFPPDNGHVRPTPDPNVVLLGGDPFDPEQWSAGLAAGGVDGFDLSDKPFYPEIIYDGEYHPICGIGFNDEAAATACRDVDRFTEATKNLDWFLDQERFTYGGRVVKTNVVLERDAMPVGACLEGESLDRCTAGGNAFGDFTALDGRCQKGNPVGVQIVCQRQCRKFGQRILLEEHRREAAVVGIPPSGEVEMVSLLQACAPFVKNTTTYYLEDLTAAVDYTIYGSFITQFSSLLGVMGQRCSANVVELICHTVFKECKPVDVEDPLTGGVARVMLPSLLCKTECERHKAMWDECYANIQKDAADMGLFESNMEAMSQLMSNAHKKATGQELPTGLDGARSPFGVIDCDAKGGMAADDIPDEEVAASWILGRYPQSHFLLGGMSGTGVIGWAFPRFMSSEMLYPETSSTYTGPDGVSYDVPCTVPGQADAVEVTCSPPFTKSILPETNRACVHVCPVGQFSVEEYTTMWAVFVAIGMLSFVLNLFMLATWKLAGRRQFQATPFQLKSCVFWGLLYGIVETIPSLILKYDLPCKHPTEEGMGSSWSCYVNRSSFFMLLGITVNLCTLTINIFRALVNSTAHESNMHVNALSTAVPLLFMVIAYVLDTSEEATENYHLNVSRHSFNCSMRFSTMVEEWLVLWLPFCVSCILTAVCSIASWLKIGDIERSLGMARNGASRTQSEGQKTLAGQRRRLIRIAAMVSMCLLFSLALVGQATVQQAAWTEYEEKKLDCLIKTGETRNFQDYGFNKKDVVEDVCPVHDEHLCSLHAQGRFFDTVTCGWYPYMGTNSFWCNIHKTLEDYSELMTCECSCSYLTGTIVERLTAHTYTEKQKCIVTETNLQKVCARGFQMLV